MEGERNVDGDKRAGGSGRDDLLSADATSGSTAGMEFVASGERAACGCNDGIREGRVSLSRWSEHREAGLPILTPRTSSWRAVGAGHTITDAFTASTASGAVATAALRSHCQVRIRNMYVRTYRYVTSNTSGGARAVVQRSTDSFLSLAACLQRTIAEELSA